MLSRILIFFVGLIIINIGSFIRIQLIQRDTSWKEFKIYIIILNIAYVILMTLYIMGIVKIR